MKVPVHLTLAILLSGAGSVQGAQQNLDQVEIETVRVADGIFMLVGAGGNIGVSAGEDAVFLVDDQFAPLTEKIRAAVARISSQPIRFVLNTHWHGDHTGGNENLGEAGVLIVGHDHVRARMSVEQFMEALNRRVPPSPAKALPVVTFNDTVTSHLNGQTIHAFHVPPAHTDGDSVIHFREGNVVHMGDLFFNGLYPFIDLSGGGSVDGMIAAADRVLALTDGNTKIIPGHGPLADRESLRRYREMLFTVRSRVQELIAAGKRVEEVLQARPSREFDETWGKGFMSPENFLRIVYSSLRRGGS